MPTCSFYLSHLSPNKQPDSELASIRRSRRLLRVILLRTRKGPFAPVQNKSDAQEPSAARQTHNSSFANLLRIRPNPQGQILKFPMRLRKIVKALSFVR